MKIRICAAILATVCLMTGCGENYRQPEEQAEEETGGQNDPEANGGVVPEGQMVTVWDVYWDLEDTDKELRQLGESVSGICHFGAYFQEDDRLFIPSELNLYTKQVMQQYPDVSHFLTVVNDIRYNSGTAAQKDTELLNRLLASEQTMEAHADQILKLVQEGGYDGVELDYERIRENMGLWEKYLQFIQILYGKTKTLGLKMRVLLEPQTPMEQLEFPEGPCYIMMCYNLHSSGTDPGPKADQEFLRECIQKMAGVSNDSSGVALALGGYDFDENGNAVQVTEKEAVSLRAVFGGEPERDPDSAALSFTYEDEEEKKHTVWYADDETIRQWMEYVRDAGETNISLWRLGGNRSLG